MISFYVVGHFYCSCLVSVSENSLWSLSHSVDLAHKSLLCGISGNQEYWSIWFHFISEDLPKGLTIPHWRLDSLPLCHPGENKVLYYLTKFKRINHSHFSDKWLKWSWLGQGESTPARRKKTFREVTLWCQWGLPAEASHEECGKQFVFLAAWKADTMRWRESNSPTKLSCMLTFSLISSDMTCPTPPWSSLCSSTWVVLLTCRQLELHHSLSDPQRTLKSHHSFSEPTVSNSPIFHPHSCYNPFSRSEICHPHHPTTVVIFPGMFLIPSPAKIYTSFSQHLEILPGNVPCVT